MYGGRAGDVWRSGWRCMEVWLELYGGLAGDVWRSGWRCMEVWLEMYGWLAAVLISSTGYRTHIMKLAGGD